MIKIWTHSWNWLKKSNKIIIIIQREPVRERKKNSHFFSERQMTTVKIDRVNERGGDGAAREKG